MDPTSSPAPRQPAPPMTFGDDLVMVFDLLRRMYAAPESARELPPFHADRVAWATEFFKLAARGEFGDVTDAQRRRLLELSGFMFTPPPAPPPVSFAPKFKRRRRS